MLVNNLVFIISFFIIFRMFVKNVNTILLYEATYSLRQITLKNVRNGSDF